MGHLSEEKILQIPQSVRLCGVSIEQYFKDAEKMHGNLAPGLVIGGFMVNLARDIMGAETICDVVVETAACLPDAVQLLTPCSTGNGWMRINNVGKYALTMYDKFKGDGVRVWLDCNKLDPYPNLKEWFLKLKPKKEQNKTGIIDDMLKAGCSALSFQMVHVCIKPKKSKGAISVCPVCGEAYPAKDGPLCIPCSGKKKYYKTEGDAATPHIMQDVPLKRIPVEEAIGKPLAHDITRVVPGEFKGPQYSRGYVVEPGDVCRLQQLGKNQLYVIDHSDKSRIHEDDAIVMMAQHIAGPGITYKENPKEGKINFKAERDGLFFVDKEALTRFNMIPEVMCATRHRYTPVKSGTMVAGSRAIPLMAHREQIEEAIEIASAAGGLISVMPLKKAKTGLLITGNEIFKGLIKDRFEPILTEKLENFGSRVIASKIVPDDPGFISSAIQEMLSGGADLVITTAGLSVDPDDVTRKGVMKAGATDMVYGSAVLPGAMAMAARIGNVPILGIPACGLYFKHTIFDLLLPRVLAGFSISAYDLAEMGHGGLCLSCSECRFPACSFGKV